MDCSLPTGERLKTKTWIIRKRMKSPIKKLKSQRLKLHRQMAACLKPQVNQIGRRWRLASRIRLANIKASQHPKQTFTAVVGCLVILLTANIALSNRETEGSFAPTLSEIATMEPLFDGFRHIQANKTVQQNRIFGMAAEGKVLHARLDSLIALPVKTHSDSIRIVSDYRRLEQIVKSLNNNTHAKN